MSRRRPAAPAAARAPSSPPSTAVASPARGRRTVLVASGAVLLAAVGVGTLVLQRGRGGAGSSAGAERPELVSDHAPSVGDAAAKVHIVEFLDPACETCAVFYPLVKQMVADDPGRIRLSLRHVALHPGADYVVAMLEASRKQGKYWQALEALLQSQNQWVPRHVVLPDPARRVMAAAGLNMDQLAIDMKAPDIADRIARDRRDATALNVQQTPEYFVNGRQMQDFGRQQLQALVRDALRTAY